jgi:transcriptional regulator with XRE-family HTH domain
VSFLGVAFGRAIKARRKELKMSQAEFASEMEVEPPTASRWETGQSLPVNERIDEILKVLKLSADAFLHRMTAPVALKVAERSAEYRSDESAKLAILRLVLDMSEADARGLLATLESDVPDLGSDEVETPATRRR